MTAKTKRLDVSPLLATTADIQMYIRAWDDTEGDNLAELQYVLEDSLKAVKRMQKHALRRHANE